MDDETSEPEECVISHDYSERKRISSAKYYRNKWQKRERVREQKRIKMAQKRAEKKAKRRQSDKPRIKSEPTTSIARMPTAGRAAPRARARVQARTEAALTFPNDANATQIESRNVSDAERPRVGIFLTTFSKIGGILRVCMKGGTPQRRTKWACELQHHLRSGGSSMFLEGVEEDFAPSEYSYEERSRSHPNPWLQPVPGGPDAKSNRLYAPSGIISRSLAAAAFPHLEYSSCDLVCNLRYSERKFNSLGLERA
ncbi:hypothetical protein K438DRAFT_1763946 [Mycena galopus ATCC 62051]|nr:hypothetical protein K438DRAFT_1763946 [Mycena galopus ATCC 62051]